MIDFYCQCGKILTKTNIEYIVDGRKKYKVKIKCPNKHHGIGGWFDGHTNTYLFRPFLETEFFDLDEL